MVTEIKRMKHNNWKRHLCIFESFCVCSMIIYECFVSLCCCFVSIFSPFVFFCVWSGFMCLYFVSFSLFCVFLMLFCLRFPPFCLFVAVCFCDVMSQNYLENLKSPQNNSKTFMLNETCHSLYVIYLCSKCNTEKLQNVYTDIKSDNIS